MDRSEACQEERLKHIRLSFIIKKREKGLYLILILSWYLIDLNHFSLQRYAFFFFVQVSGGVHRNGNIAGNGNNGGVSPRNQGDQVTNRKRPSDQSLETFSKKRKVNENDQQVTQVRCTSHRVIEIGGITRVFYVCIPYVRIKCSGGRRVVSGSIMRRR